ncbi:NAD kinase-like isoform X1 [Biomphalaria glabrata]|uniref:NAD(+) kinase n=1 Tax=Biomphalaria glabrata TaxID=6526 RepID=A0A9W2YN84_BIOGL|nr:NAD kinase-like isoform X1 [Biomphalaria glabrata]XP_055864162.1 NAD kinase-like isoform X1 [Biomphalaria glabrata]
MFTSCWLPVVYNEVSMSSPYHCRVSSDQTVSGFPESGHQNVNLVSCQCVCVHEGGTVRCICKLDGRSPGVVRGSAQSTGIDFGLSPFPTRGEWSDNESVPADIFSAQGYFNSGAICDTFRPSSFVVSNPTSSSTPAIVEQVLSDIPEQRGDSDMCLTSTSHRPPRLASKHARKNGLRPASSIYKRTKLSLRRRCLSKCKNRGRFLTQTESQASSCFGCGDVAPRTAKAYGTALEAIISDDEINEKDFQKTDILKRRRCHLRRLSECSNDIWSAHKKSFTCSASTIPDPSNQKLNWTKEPLSVLIVRKHLDESVMIPFRDLLIWLVEAKNMVVLVEQSVMDDRILKDDKDFQRLQDKLSTFKEDDDLTDKVDFIICLGGDGTLLYVSSLFQSNVPPVMAFNMGSLGFLTPFRFSDDFKTEVSKVMQGSASLLLRYRLKCVVVRHDTEPTQDIPHVKNIQKEDVWTKTHKLVLNEVVVDRGPSSYLCNLELYIEGRRVTSVQGDGLIISTPTGSTAYAVAAGASMIHPSVPCILLTPICPHSLSFRPIVVPAGVEIKVMLSPDARGTAMVSFDGRDRMEIHQGDSLRITTSNYPVPSICATDQIEDWFDGLANCLNWNIRHQQKPLQTASSVSSFESLEAESSKSSQVSLLNGNS